MLLKTSYIKISFFFSSFLLRVAIKKATVTCSWRFICSDILKLDARDAYLRFMRNKLTGHFLLSTASTKAQENKTKQQNITWSLIEPWSYLLYGHIILVLMRYIFLGIKFNDTFFRSTFTVSGK